MSFRWFESRLKVERKVMERELPQFMFFNNGGEPYFQGYHRTTTDRLLFKLKLPLPKGYPEVLPPLYVTYPLPLHKYGGAAIDEVSHSFHTLGKGPGGCLKICHFGSANWDSSKSCVGVLFKGMLWCEAYAVHLRTGLNISEIIDNWRRTQHYGKRTR